MSNWAWLLLTVGCAGFFAACICTAFIAATTRSLRRREQMVLLAETGLQQQRQEISDALEQLSAAVSEREHLVAEAERVLGRRARVTAAEVEAARPEITLEDRLAAENDETIYVPKLKL